MIRPPSVWVATLFGLGFHSRMPGTLGSAAACLVSALVPVPWWGVLITAALGVWASDAAAKALGRTDPGCVIIDEAAGMWLSVLALPRPFLLPGFLLFRALDILKPFPVSAMERLPGGWGIMADDLLGGAAVCLLLHLVRIFL